MTITQREVKNFVALAIMSEIIGEHDQKPILRNDPGSPNMAANVWIFLRGGSPDLPTTPVRKDFTGR